MHRLGSVGGRMLITAIMAIARPACLFFRSPIWTYN